MEENNECSSKLEWEILDLYGGKQQQSDHMISPFYCNNDDKDVLRISSKAPVFSDSFYRPIKDDPSISGCFGGNKVVPLPAASYDISTCCNDVVMRADNMIIASETISPSSSVVCSGDQQLINLRLGRQTRDSGEIISNLSPDRKCNKTSMNTTRADTVINGGGSLMTTPSKRSRASYQNMQNPCCQVEGCNIDLKSAKDYHRRHRICEIHSKSVRVVVGGLVRRFCQQCSRFHDLSEFDDKKRSCRKRLSDHNARRRRLQPESLHLRSPTSSLSSALYDQRSQNVVLNGLSISLSSNSKWDENGTNTIMRQQTRESSSLVRPLLNVGSGLEGTACFLSDQINPNSISNLHIDSSERLCSFQSPRSTRVSDQCVRVTSRTDSHMAPDLLSAHSLLSSNSWSLNDAVSSSMNKNSRVSVMNSNINDDSSNNNADMDILAAGKGGESSVSLIHREGTASSSSHLHDQHGNCFFFHPKEFYE